MAASYGNDLHRAVKNNDALSVNEIVADRPGLLAERTTAGYTPFLLGAFIGNIEMMAMLVKHDKTVIHDLHEKPAADGPYDFTKATKLHGKPASKRATNFAKKMTGQNNALHIAARAGHGHVVRWLRTCPATKALFNVTAKGEGLENAFKKGQGHPVVMRELLKCKQGCEYVAKTGLMKYAKNLELGGMAAWVYNTYKEDEKTLPMIALEAGHFKMAEYLDDLLDKARRREFEEAEQKMLETAARAANQGDSTDMEIDQLSAGAKAKQDRKAAMLQKFQDKQAAHAQRLQAVRNQEEALSSPSRAGANDLEARVKAAAQVPLAAGDKCTLAEDYHDQDMNAQHGVLRPGEVGVVNYIKEPDSEGMVFISVRANDGHKWDYMVKAIMHAPSTTESQFDKETTTQIQNMSRSPARKVYLSTTGNLY